MGVGLLALRLRERPLYKHVLGLLWAALCCVAGVVLLLMAQGPLGNLARNVQRVRTTSRQSFRRGNNKPTKASCWQRAVSGTTIAAVAIPQVGLVGLRTPTNGKGRCSTG